MENPCALIVGRHGFSITKELLFMAVSSTSPLDLLTLSNALDPATAANFPLAGALTVAGAMIRTSLATGITAFAGGGQGSATALTAGVNDVTVCATGGDSTKLPSPTAGQQVIVANSGAASMNLFPQSGHSINAGAANAQVAVGVGKVAICTAISATKWLATVGA
jgi:hypothetical protein